jgi:ligand-binding SRPBCC domain-containing protein
MYDALTVENSIFDITQQIEQADSTMMLRELGDNAFVASSKAKQGQVKFIKFDPSILGLEKYNQNKFAIWNNGVGLNSHFLLKMTNLSSSINKTQSLKDNYGKGAKIASLAVNRSGLIYVSCKDGLANYLVLGEVSKSAQGEPIYGRFDLSGNGDLVADCTEEMNNAGFDTTEEWTMVVLCGNDPKQDTIKEPFGSKITNAWAFNDIYTRFFRIPENIELRFEVGHSKGKDAIPVFKPISQYIKDKADNHQDKMKQEWVQVNDGQNQGIKIWYIWDGPWGESHSNEGKPTSTIGNPATRSMFSGLVFKNETYSVSDGNVWKQDASYMGILAGSNHLRVFVELPDSFDCQPDLYRKHLEYSFNENGLKKKITLSIRDFAEVVYNNMPNWFKEKCKEYDNAKGANNDVVNKLSELLNRLSLRETQKQQVNVSKYKSGAGQTKGAGVTGNGGGTGTGGRTKHNANSPYGGSNLGKNLTKVISTKFKKVQITKQVPDIKFIWTEDELDQYGLPETFKWRAGHFQRSVDKEVIFVNCISLQYTHIHNFVSLEFNHQLQTDKIDTLEEAKDITTNLLTWRIGSAVVRALAQENRDGWASTDVEKILNPETLTLAADSWEDDTAEIKSQIRETCKILKLNKVA